MLKTISKKKEDLLYPLAFSCLYKTEMLYESDFSFQEEVKDGKKHKYFVQQYFEQYQARFF